MIWPSGPVAREISSAPSPFLYQSIAAGVVERELGGDGVSDPKEQGF